jgi:hypothetical protein
MTSSETGTRHGGWLKRKLSRVPVWISLPVLLVVGLGGVAVAFVFLFFGAFYFLLCVPDNWARDRLEPEMAAAGLEPPSAKEIDRNLPRPVISSTSPDGFWTVTASWNNNQGYDWELRNDQTGQIYPQGYRAKDSCRSWPLRLSFHWSPDGHYLAINTTSEDGVHLEVLTVAGVKPEYLGRDPGSTPIEDNKTFIMDSFDSGGKWTVQNLRSRALRWKNKTDLECVLYVDEFEMAQPYEVQTAAHATYHFEGNSFTVMATRRDFYEKLITDL